MNQAVLSGVLCAWALAHLGLSVFFALAYLIGRRESEYLLFSLICATLSVFAGGQAFDFAGQPLEARMRADQVVHGAAIIASVLNVHFAACFAFERRRARWLLPLYGMAALLFVANCAGAFWVPGSYIETESRALGFDVRHAIGRVTPIGMLHYAFGSLEVFAAPALLLWAYLRGRREALTALIGAVIIVLALLNDVGLSLGYHDDTLNLLPHVFLLYAFGAAGTLLWRYRVAAAELEQTTHRLRQRTEELHNSYAELAEVQSELVMKKQLAAVGELAAAIAHEVRNPLAVIVNAVAGLRRVGLREDDRTMLLGIVEEEAGRLNRLVTDLLRFARPVAVKRSPVSLPELANRSRIHADERYEVRVIADDDASKHTVYVDPNLFRLVFDNLVSNAFQAMRDGGVVEIYISRAEFHDRPAARIEIRDHGHGMEPQVMERALDPFFTTRPSGTGLGLPIVHRIIEAHGGELTLASDEGEGTVVTIVVPVHSPEESLIPAAEERVA